MLETPICPNGHPMTISNHDYGQTVSQGVELGYQCDKCGGNPIDGECDGMNERWFCERCAKDICFKCVPHSRAINGK